MLDDTMTADRTESSPEATNSPRVAFLWHGDRNIGGGEYSAWALARHLRPEFSPVLLYTVDNPLVTRYERDGIPIVRVAIDRRLTTVYRDTLGLRSSLRQGHPWLLAKAVREVISTLRHQRIQLLHPVDNLSKILGGIAARVVGVRAVCHCQDLLNASRVEQLLRRYQLVAMDRVIAVSNAVARNLGNETSHHKVVVIPNGIDTDAFDPTQVPKADLDASWIGRRTVIAMIAAFDALKGHRYLLQALAQRLEQGHDDWRCIFVGEGREEEAIRREVSRRALDGHVRLLGYRHDIPAILQAIDILVVASERETFSLVAAEAMAMRKVVVACRVGGLGETVDDGVTGLLVHHGDVDELTNALDRLLSNPALCRSMGAEGRRRVADRFTVAENVRRTKALYAEVLG